MGRNFGYDEEGGKVASRYDIGLEGVKLTGVTWPHQGDVVLKEITLNGEGEVYFQRELRID